MSIEVQRHTGEAVPVDDLGRRAPHARRAAVAGLGCRPCHAADVMCDSVETLGALKVLPSDGVSGLVLHVMRRAAATPSGSAGVD
jgi:hypothetical protein